MNSLRLLPESPAVHSLYLRTGHTLLPDFGDSQIPCYGKSGIYMVSGYHHRVHMGALKARHRAFRFLPWRVYHSHKPKEHHVFLIL